MKSKDNFFTKVIKGGIIGVGSIIPGSSGGTLACVLGVYEEIVGAISDLTKNFKKSVSTLIPYIIGFALFVLTFIYPITWGIDNYPFVTISLFVGLILGTIPSFYKNVKGKFSLPNLGWFILGVAIILATIIPSLITGESYVSLAHPTFINFLMMFLMGILASCALVIPGVSGMLILLLLGYYTPIMDTIKAFLFSLGFPLNSFSASFDTSVLGTGYILPSLGLLAIFAVGVIIGFIAISKVMKFLLNKYSTQTYFAIFGFILASLGGMYAKPSYYLNLNTMQIILGIILLIFGFFISFLLFKLQERKTK